MSYSTYLLTAGRLKTPLQPNYITLTIANNTELINKGSTLITLNLGEKKDTLKWLINMLS